MQKSGLLILILLFSCKDRPTSSSIVVKSDKAAEAEEASSAKAEELANDKSADGSGSKSEDVKSPAPQYVPLSACHKGDAWTCDIEAAIVAETNALRPSALKQSFEVSYVSRLWSQEQADRNKIGHEGFPKARIEALRLEFPGIRPSVRAENVAMTRTSQDDPAKLAKTFVTMWYNSEGHRRNMLGDYRFIGVGVSRKDKSVYATQIFY